MSDQLDEPWRRHPSFLRAAAWIPEADQNLQRWEELKKVAVAWVEEQASLDDVTPVVFFNAAKAYGGHGPVQALASRHGYSFPLERGGRRGAVLAVRPDARSLHRAADLARGLALVVLRNRVAPGVSLDSWTLKYQLPCTGSDSRGHRPPRRRPVARSVQPHRRNTLTASSLFMTAPRRSLLYRSLSTITPTGPERNSFVMADDAHRVSNLHARLATRNPFERPLDGQPELIL